MFENDLAGSWTDHVERTGSMRRQTLYFLRWGAEEMLHGCYYQLSMIAGRQSRTVDGFFEGMSMRSEAQRYQADELAKLSADHIAVSMKRLVHKLEYSLTREKLADKAWILSSTAKALHRLALVLGRSSHLVVGECNCLLEAYTSLEDRA